MRTTAAQHFPRARTLVLALLAALVGGALLAAPAQAHDRLVASTPSADQSVDVAPDQLVLSFSNEPLDLGHTVVVRDAAGAEVAVGEPVVAGRDVDVALPPLPAGAYTVVWRVVSQDGHPIEGTYGFAVTTGVAPTTAATSQPAPSGSAPPSPSATSSSAPTSGTSTSALPLDEDVTPPTDGGGGVPAWALVLVAVAAAAGAATLLLNRRRGVPPSG
jgi:methionine-rich copper-binding protein CopC